MAGKVRSLSTLVENQLPEFISTDYPNFVKFVEKYYEQLESPGQPLDIINLTKYQDIDTYEKKILQQNTTLVSIVETRNSSNVITEVVINLLDGSSFPKKNGYVMIKEEVIFYQYKIGNSLRNCYRNVSATTKLGDLYNTSEYVSIPYSEVGKGSSGQTVSGPSYLAETIVQNISNLFLYAFVRNFETQYLAAFPEESLKETVDKKTLIKNIKQFYKAKGTDQSIQFIFNSIVAKEIDDVPTVYYPKEYTFKASNGEWVSNYALKVKVISGNISNILGQRIIQEPDDLDPYAISSFAVVDNVIDSGNGFYEIVIAPESIVGEFKVAAETQLTKPITLLDTANSIINVFSTTGWNSSSGKILINNEQITYKSKNVNQFVIENRGSVPQAYPIGTKVYNYTAVQAQYPDSNGFTQTVKLVVLGVLYNLSLENAAPYSSVGDKIQESKTGFETRDPIIYDRNTGNTRWAINEALSNPSSSLIPLAYTSNISKLNSDVSAVYQDDQYYYITSSGFPSHDFGKTSWNKILSDQKFLKIIKKSPSLSTEISQTSQRDVGVAINGIPFYSNKDYTKIGSVDNDVIFGGIIDITLTSKGKGYLNPPYVLIEEKIGVEAAKAKAVLSGEVVDHILVEEGGTGYFPPEPTVTITSGRGATATAVVTLGKITSLKLTNEGEYYSTPPEVRIIDSLGKGKFARYATTISNDGKVTGFIKEDEGKNYIQENVTVKIVSVGDGATGIASVKRWKKNRFNVISNSLDNSNGYVFENINPALGYGYAYVANPKALRIAVGDNLESNGSTSITLSHSKILGYAYDGNPIYGPYGYTNPLDSETSITRMISSYEVKPNRIDGPPVSAYSLGFFVEDYQYNHRLGTLDENNGRFCVTPEYPEGVYAYFITVNSEDTPVFPYIIGNTFYGIPVDSNYNRQISQNDLPKLVDRLRTNNIPNNGNETYSYIDEINSGGISNVDIFSSHNNFSVGSLVEVDNSSTEGSGIIAKVSSVKGKGVSSLENRQTKAVQIRIENTAYLFKDDILYQQNTNASGQIIGDVLDANNIVLRNVSGTFNLTDRLYSNTKVVNLIVDKSSDFTIGSTLTLTNGKQVIISNVTNNTLNVSSNPFVNAETIVFSNTFSGIVANTLYYVRNRTINSFQISSTSTGPIITLTNNNTPTSVAVSEKARALILETTEDKNNIKSKVIQGEFVVDGSYFLISSTRTDTVGVRVSQVNRLSENIKIFALNNNIGIVTTTTEHNIAEGDSVIVDIKPNDVLTTTTYYVRKRIYQKIKLKTPTFETIIADTGLGRLRFLNSGADYALAGSQTFTNIEIIFADQSKCRDIDGRIVGSSNSAAVLGNVGGSSNAKATVTVTSGLVSSVLITSKGIGYKKGDLVTFSNTSLQRISGSISTQYFIADVDHVGFSFSETKLKLNKVDGLSQNDLIKIGKEVIKINTINFNTNTVTVTRSQESTTAIDHFNLQPVVLYKSKYNLSKDYNIGNTSQTGIVQSYDETTQTLIVVYELSSSLETIKKVDLNYTFFDTSTPKKLVGIDKIIEDADYQFEFSKINTLTADWIRNPIIDIQKYYRYKFDTSNTSLVGSFLEFSPSGNYNILTLESYRSIQKPGSVDSYIEIKFGFGAFYAEENLTEKKQINYINYFYFDKNNIIKNDKSYLRVIEDPLQGLKRITYVTSSKFVYELNNVALYDGTGNISYTTTSQSTTGNIDKISISNPGKGFKKLPTITGIRPATSLECISKCNWNSVTKNIDSVSVISAGKNYSKPKAILVTGDGILAEFFVSKNADGSIKAILVNNKGKNYSYQPEIKIIETDLSAYFSSETIGVAKSIKIVNNGCNFNRDKSISKKYSGGQILILKEVIPNAFFDGEEIVQYDGNTLIAKGTITEGGWRLGSNVLRLQSLEGIFRLDLPIVGRANNNTAIIIKTFVGLFNSEIKSYYDNLGYYISDRSNIGSESQRIADSYFYQDYSYTIKSRTPTDVWRNLIKNTTHPAGFKVFGEVEINTKGSVEFIPNPIKNNIVSFIQLWDPQKNRVTIESTRRVITSSIVKVKDVNEVRGKGSAYVAPFDTSETISYEFYLTPSFDGYIDENGNRAGTKTFNMKIKGSNSILNVSNINNLVISLDGIIQEPSKAYNISNSTLTFVEAPLGYRDLQGNPISTINYQLGVHTPQQYFIGRLIKFKDSTLNNENFRKIKDISTQFDNIKTAFQLYYDDNTPVQLPSTDNLIVSIDGVIQRSGTTPLIPSDRSYYIRRTTTPNEIVFVEAPRKFEEISSSNIFNKAKQSFFAYNVGAYERLVINEKYIDDEFTGPFTLRSAVTGKTIAIDDDRNVLVFVEEVLQKRLQSYTIRGSNISFIEPLRVGQKINIMYLYGRNATNFITMFDFDCNEYLNRIEMVINYNPGIKQFDRILCYQGNSIATNTAIGYIKKFNIKGNNTIFTIETQNKTFVSTKNVYCVDGRAGGFGDIIIPSASIISIGQPNSVNYFEENEDTLDILRKTTTGWLMGSSIQANYWNALAPDDQIKIDGENEYRNIFSIPTEVIKTEYRENADVTNGYLGKLSASNYNGIQLGEGLDIVVNVDTNASSSTFGQVTSLTWNKKDYDRYETKQILPRPAGYSYEDGPRLNFVPQALKDEGGSIITPASGGGAKAYVVVHNGEPIDVVLTDVGGGYACPPKVYITRGYYVKKSKKNSHHRIITNFFTPPAIITSNTFITSEFNSVSSSLPEIIYYEDIIFTKIDNINIVATAFITGKAEKRIPEIQPNLKIISYLELDLLSNIFDISYSINSGIQPIFPTVEQESNVTIIGSNRQILSDLRSFLKLIQSPVYPALHDTGGYLQSPLSETDPIVYIVDTTKFTVSGRLMIDGEIIRYGNKLSDRFIDIIRGVDGTNVTTHEAGAFVRQYRENVTLVSAVSEISINPDDPVILIPEIISNIFVAVSSNTSNITTSKQITISPTIINTETNSLFTIKYYETGIIDWPTQNNNYISEYSKGNVGNNVSTLNSWRFMDVGNIINGGMTLQEFELNYGSLTLNDYENNTNSNSAYLISGAYFNAGYPSISESGAILNTNMTTTSTTLTANTTTVGSSPLFKFPSNGYIRIGKELISYTGKTTNSLTGIVRSVNGILESHSIGEYFITSN